MNQIELPTTTRRDNGDGTYRYLIDSMPDFELKASKVLYTHASIYLVGGTPCHVMFHKNQAAAERASYKYGTKVAVREVEEATS